jgi:hypothetical protein
MSVFMWMLCYAGNRYNVHELFLRLVGLFMKLF